MSDSAPSLKNFPSESFLGEFVGAGDTLAKGLSGRPFAGLATASLSQEGGDGPDSAGVGGRDPVRDRPRVRPNLADEPHLPGDLGLNHAAGQHQVRGGTRPDNLGQPDGPTPGAEQAQLNPRFPEGRLGCRDPQVTGERELHATATSGPVDPGDDGAVVSRERRRHRLTPLSERDRTGPVEPGNGLEVGTSTERLAGASEEYHRLACGVECRRQLVESRRREGVSLLRAVEREHADRPVGSRTEHIRSKSEASKGLCVRSRNGSRTDLAATAERAARTAVADIEPVKLREEIDNVLADGSVVPGALTFRVGTVGDDDAGAHSVDGPLGRRAAGVQLVFAGLDRTRHLATDADWTADVNTGTETDLALLGADVAVARGAYLLARTAAADRAVGVVRRFGRNQTEAETSDAGPGRSRCGLERDALELAVIAGGTVGGEAVASQLEEAVGELATLLIDEDGAFRAVDRVHSEAVANRLAASPTGSTTD